MDPRAAGSRGRARGPCRARGPRGSGVEALQLLRGTQAEREQGIDALRVAWDENPGAAVEAFPF